MSRSLAALKAGVQRARLIGASGGGERQKDDFYATPAESTRALLEVPRKEMVPLVSSKW